jgi:hypothetical protein
MIRFLFDDAQQPDGSFPRNSLIDGTVAPDTFGLSEIDQDAYPLLMAWQAGLAGNVPFYQAHIRPAGMVARVNRGWVPERRWCPGPVIAARPRLGRTLWGAPVRGW